MSAIVETEQCFPREIVLGWGPRALRLPAPAPAHGACEGGQHIPGVLGGWHCPCKCHEAPKRIRLQRTKGWRKPDGVVVVSRPSRWGNPYPVGKTLRGELFSQRDSVRLFQDDLIKSEAWWHDGEEAHRFHLLKITPIDVIRELRGKDLACWCPVNVPCHADILLEVANGSPVLKMEVGDQ